MVRPLVPGNEERFIGALRAILCPYDAQRRGARLYAAMPQRKEVPRPPIPAPCLLLLLGKEAL